MADYNFEIQHRAGSQHGNSDGLSRRPCENKKCTRDDCEIGYRRTDENHRTDRSGTATAGTLRSEKPYLKNGPTRRNQQETSNLQPTSSEANDQGTDFGTLDIPWETIRQAQESGLTLKKILELLTDPEPPNNVNEFGMGLVNLWNQRKSLEIINGVIHRNLESAEGLLLHRQILVPEPLRKTFLFWVHGDPCSGHFGVQKITDKLQHFAYWSGWRKDVELFVRRCDQCCRYRKGPTRPQGAMKNGVGLAPFQKFHIDLTGPHSKSSGGHVYLLTGICCFTKYLIAVPLKDKTALTVANALLKTLYLIYGAVELQVYDNGPEFVNSALSHLSKMLGIQDLRSTAYRPVANSAIERAHRTINAVFAKTIRDSPRDWHEQAKFVCFAYNTARHSSTLFSLFYLVFLREPRVGIDLFLDRSEPGYQSTDEYSEIVQERMRKACQIVSDQPKVTFDRAKRRYDQRVHAVHFPLNSCVWFFCPRLTAGRSRKFKKLTDGPFRVVRVLNDVNYVIQEVPGGRLQICHVDRLLRYEGEPPAVCVRFDNENNRSPELLTEKNQMVPTETSQQQSKVRKTKLRVRNIGTANKKIRSKYSGRVAFATNKQRQSPDVDSKLGGNPVSSWNQGTMGTKNKVSKQTGPRRDMTKQRTLASS